MKKIYLGLLIFLAALNISGCAAESTNTENSTSSAEESTAEKEEQGKNTLFTDEFFEDVEIINCNPCGVVTGEQIEPVVEFLKNLTLDETEEHIAIVGEEGEPLDGAFWITFRKSDNYEITFYMDGYGTFTYHSTSVLVETFSYTAGTNIIGDLKTAFSQGEKIS